MSSIVQETYDESFVCGCLNYQQPMNCRYCGGLPKLVFNCSHCEGRGYVFYPCPRCPPRDGRVCSPETSSSNGEDSRFGGGESGRPGAKGKKKKVKTQKRRG
ncbi:hypothetical protein SAPIO_CDS10831 [Scedosporium apiospermum]|uniref:Uncharacterized protein n=1 Tax=Pseudallescheria apiosperma TaxID=563466 RepID=A0A084FUN0_PSEDA|nr:uncharacterized protein SAPIO_CDS10831 [Scedosporium apiospermum]KEZ38792.1 hypothetical protein SAPIO_CDS10831 [Scedosporium apiospermum]